MAVEPKGTIMKQGNRTLVADGSTNFGSSWTVVSRTTQTQTTQPTTTTQKPTTREAQIEQIKLQALEAKAKADAIQAKIKTVAAAEKAGLKIDTSTTVQDANEFLGDGQPADTGDPEFDDNVNSLPPELRDLIKRMQEQIDELSAQGLAVNPDIQITEAELQQFLEQAQQESEGFFSGEQKAVLTDLQRGLSRQTQLTGQTEEDIQRQSEQELRGIGESAADRGIAFSGERLRQERELGGATGRAIDRGREALQFSGQSAALSAERQVGSEALRNFAFPTGPSGNLVGRVEGGISGTLPRERETSTLTRRDQLAQEERRRRLELAGT